MSNILDLAKKLKALADKGEGGEATNAAEMLQRLCEKHGIDLSSLDEEIKRERRFSIPDIEFEIKFFVQIVASVIGRSFDIGGYRLKKYEPKKGYATQVIEMTDAQYIEVEAKYEFYRKRYEEDFKIFYRAFIHRNDLGVKSEGPEKEYTDEELRELRKVFELAQSLDKHRLHKQLKSSTP